MRYVDCMARRSYSLPGIGQNTEAAMRDFSSKTRSALAARGITIDGLTVIPSDGDMPFANGQRGYRVSDNGCGRVWTFAQVIEAAQ